MLLLKNTESCLIDDCPVIGPKKSSFLSFVICLAAEREKVIYMTETKFLAKIFLFPLTMWDFTVSIFLYIHLDD